MARCYCGCLLAILVIVFAWVNVSWSSIALTVLGALLALKALALQARGESTAALVPLAKSLALAQPAGYVRTFVDEGAPMARLLRQAAARGIAPEYTARLLAALGPYPGDEVAPGTPPGPAGLVEPLSERELEVLQLVATGLTNREIAGELVVAIGTVKAHVHNITGKLGARNRTEAVARAREFRLL